MSPNVLGYVVEVSESFLDGEARVQLKLRLKNTLGKEQEVWVDGPSNLVGFYGAEIPDTLPVQ